MENKKLIITGKLNIDALTKDKKERIRVNSIEKPLVHELSLSLLFELNRNLNEDLNNRVIREIDNKINSYKNQDIKKGIYNKNTLITLIEVRNKLLSSFLHCNYCNKKVKLLYRVVRDPEQWTLDRIDNKKNHSEENTVIACLNCNLKRRNINKEDFEFSQQMNIVKLEEI